MLGGFIFMCVFVSLIAIVAVLYFNYQDKANGKNTTHQDRNRF